jgi:hypothetical protein
MKHVVHNIVDIAIFNNPYIVNILIWEISEHIKGFIMMVHI